MQDIYIGDQGKGIPLVLLHGFLGSSKMWGPQIEFFKNYYRVITPDIPGFGRSNKIKSSCSILIMANKLLASLKKKKIKNFYLLGHSMGGMIAQEMAKKNGSNILKLICYSTGPVGEMPGRFETVEQSRENLKRWGLETMVKKIVKTWFIKGDKAKYFDICVKSGKKCSLTAADNALKSFQKWNGINTLKYIKNKTLIVWGDQDKSYNFDQVKILEKKIRGSKLIIFKDCAHNIHLEKLNDFNKVIKNFLEKD